nr:hypothetical protein [Tanacetum cinerariifolium]
MLPIELTNADIKNFEAYKEYYAVATRATPPKTKASVQKTKSSSDTTITPPPTAAAGTRLSTSAKGKQPAKASKAKNGGTGTIPGVPDVPTDESDEEISWKLSDEGDDDDDQEEGNDDDQDSDEGGEEFIHPRLSIHDEEETRDEESFDSIAKTPENTDDEGNGEENIGLNVGGEEGQDEEDDEDELYRDVNINLEGRVVQMADVHTTQEFEGSHVTLTLINPDGQQQSSSMDVQAPTIVALLPLSTPTLTPSTIATITTVPQAPTAPTTSLSTLLQNLPNFSSLFGFDHRLKTLEDNFSEFVQTNKFARAVSFIPGIVQRYMDQRMNEAVKVAVQIQSDRLRDEAQADNEEFLKNLAENIQKIIKEQVKEQVNVQISMILPRIEQTVNEQLKAEVLTQSSNSSKTSYVVVADLSEMELKKILIEKMEDNKSIHRSNEQRNLYKALVEAYESDKIILDTYRYTVTLKRRRNDDADKDEEPSAGSDRGSKRRREGKEPELASAPKENATRSTGKSTQGSKSRQTESTRDVYSKRRIITVTELKIVEWHNYKYLDWITVRRDDDKLYKFKEGDFKRLCIQGIEDMLLLLKKLNLTRLDTYRSDLKCKEAYTAYSNPRGFIYQNKDKQNRLMRIDELHKFSNGTLTDVRTALDDRLKGIQMKTRRIMRSLERLLYSSSIQYKEYLENSSNATTPDLPTKEPDNSLSMGDEHLDTISETESDEVIKSSVEDLVPILSESDGISDDTCDCLFEKSVTFSNPLFNLNDDFTSSDDESLSDEDVPEDNVKIYSNLLFEFDDEYISSDVNPLFDEVLENIESKDSIDSNLDEPDLLVTPFFDVNEDEFFNPGGDVDEINDFKDGYYDLEGDILYLESLISNDTTPNLPPKVFLDRDLRILSDEPNINDLMTEDKVLNPEIHDQIFSPTYVSLPFEDRHYLFFTYVFRIFLPHFTYPVKSPFLLSSRSEDTIFDPGISAFHFSHQSGTFISFNVYLNILNESPMEICSSTRFYPNITMIWDFDDSRARGFVRRPLELLSLAYGNSISKILLI